MAIRLSPEQEALVHEVLASGAVPSEDDALTIALTFLRDHVTETLEDRLGMPREAIEACLEEGRTSPAQPWMGVEAFCTAMRGHGASHQ